jgi:hypothetical protein
MPRAVCLIKDTEPYAQPHFIAGLEACGFKVSTGYNYTPTRDDVLLTWNRSGARHQIAQSFEKVGAAVIVAENGWIGRTRTGGKFYALCLGHHNGAGAWPDTGTDRWPLLNVDLAPWRESGKHVVVLCSRGIGEAGIAQPRDWPLRIVEDLKRVTSRNIRVRKHPGDSNASLADDLAGAHAVVTWASGAGIKAIAAGIPAFYGLKGWIGAAAAKRGVEEIENPFLGDRLPMFRRLAQAQWTADEIATGDPIKCLLMSQSTR